MELHTFGERLKSERNRLGLSQEAFASVGGVKKLAQISYEQGKTLPDIGFISSVAKIGVDVSFVLFGVPAAATLSDDEAQLIEGYRKLDIMGKARVLGVIEGAAPHAKPSARTNISIGGNVGQQINGDINGNVKAPRIEKKVRTQK